MSLCRPLVCFLLLRVCNSDEFPFPASQTISGGLKTASIASGVGRDQVTWTLEHCIKVFAESVDNLKADLKSRGDCRLRIILD